MRMRKKEEDGAAEGKGGVQEKAKQLAELVEVAQTTRLANPAKGLSQEEF